MKIIAYLKLFIKKFNQFDHWINKDRVGPGQLYDPETIRGGVNGVILGLICGLILWYYPIFQNYPEGKTRWLQFWAIVIGSGPVIFGILGIIRVLLKKHSPKTLEKIYKEIETNQNKTLELHKQQTLSKSIEDEIGKIEAPKAIPTSLTIEKPDDTPNVPLTPKSTRHAVMDELKQKD